jgi:hypothetical protein
MIRIRHSSILAASGEPFQDFRPDSISTWLVVSNAQYGGPDVMRGLASRLLKTAHGLNVEDDEASAP